MKSIALWKTSDELVSSKVLVVDNFDIEACAICVSALYKLLRSEEADVDEQHLKHCMLLCF